MSKTVSDGWHVFRLEESSFGILVVYFLFVVVDIVSWNRVVTRGFVGRQNSVAGLRIHNICFAGVTD